MPKILFLLSSLCITVCSLSGSMFYITLNDTSIAAAEKLIKLNYDADNFLWYGYGCCFILLFSANIECAKRKTTGWLFIPLLLTMIIALVHPLMLEDIFRFKKQNRLWKGEFSLSFLETFFLSFVALIVFLLNRFLLKHSFNKKGVENSTPV